MSFPLIPPRQPFVSEGARPVHPANAQDVQRAWHRQYLPLLNADNNVAGSDPQRLLDASLLGVPEGQDTRAIRVRWALSAMPLTVFIEGAAPEIAEMVMETAGLWQTASVVPGDTMPLASFQRLFQCADAQQADIHLCFKTDTVLGREFETGHAKRTVTDKGLITHVDVTLIENPAIYAHLGQEMRDLCFRATVLHEFGHALGLEHSQHKQDVMYHQGWRNAFLGNGDVAALRALYARHEVFLG